MSILIICGFLAVLDVFRVSSAAGSHFSLIFMAALMNGGKILINIIAKVDLWLA